MLQISIQDLDRDETLNGEKAIVKLTDLDQISIIGGCTCTGSYNSKGELIIVCK
jgi:hypothetical protein